MRWEAVDDRSANASFTDCPLSLTLRFGFNGESLISSADAAARGAAVGKQGVPMTGVAIWLRPEGRKTYFLSEVASLHFRFLP